jgi:hemoglobin
MNGLDADLVATLLDEFYDRVRQDRVLGPVFAEIIGQNWDAHMAKINSFWRTALRLDRSYPGRDFMPAHWRHTAIRTEHLPIWLKLFEEAVQRVVQEQARGEFLRIARAMAENLALGLDRRDAAISNKL